MNRVEVTLLHGNRHNAIALMLTMLAFVLALAMVERTETTLNFWQWFVFSACAITLAKASAHANGEKSMLFLGIAIGCSMVANFAAWQWLSEGKVALMDPYEENVLNFVFCMLIFALSCWHLFEPKDVVAILMFTAVAALLPTLINWQPRGPAHSTVFWLIMTLASMVEIYDETKTTPEEKMPVLVFAFMSMVMTATSFGHYLLNL